MDTKALRTKVFADLAALGFRVASSLPDPEMRAVRPVGEIVARLMALDALFTWVAFDEEEASASRVVNYAKANDLRDHLTDDEVLILDMPRARTNERHAGTIGWKLENMWSLAWVLGFEPEPSLGAATIAGEVTDAMLYEFLPGLDGTIPGFLATCHPRSPDAILAMEYRFYCAHNAVRSAQLGSDTVPPGFDPILHGGAVHERRHSLSWCAEPDAQWDETDLST